jgi:DNA-binding transcriptional regulator YdaS (Cro superfamily)
MTMPALNVSAAELLAEEVEVEDMVLDYLRGGKMRIGLDDVIFPSGVDLAACALARRVICDHSSRSVAVALPRGAQQVHFLVGLYLTLGRLDNHLPFHGSVLVSTNDMSLRPLAAKLRSAGTRIQEVVAFHRLNADGGYSGLTGSTVRGELDHAQRFLLLHLPWLRPELRFPSVSVSVVDTSATKPDTWEATFEWNEEANRFQFYVGELANPAFERFCERRDIPLVRFDWPTLAYLAERFGNGSGPLTSHRLCRRAGDARQLYVRPVEDGQTNHELHRLEMAFAAFARKSAELERKGFETPEVIMLARKLFYLLGRLCCPVDSYDELALEPYHRGLHTRTALKRVRDAHGGHFQGPWRNLDTEWSAVVGSLTALHERISSEAPKYWDLIHLLDAERDRGVKRRHVVVRCPTRLEEHALSAQLVSDGVVAAEELGPDGLVEVRSFGVRSGPLAHGRASEPVVQVICEPPPKYRGALYLSGEEGGYEALLYPLQMRRAARLAEEFAERSDGHARNLAALAKLGVGTALASPDAAAAQLPAAVIELEPFAVSGRKQPDAGEREGPAEAESLTDQLEEYLDLEGDLDLGDYGEGSSGGGDGDPDIAARLARGILVGFTTRDYTFLAEDGTADQVLRERVLPRPVRLLAPGASLVLMVGSERGSALTELFDAWDEQYAPGKIYGELWRQAVRRAVEVAGGQQQLADRLGVVCQTVEKWVTGAVIGPKADEHLNAVLKLSGIEAAWKNGTAIRRYVKRVRGAHIRIGQIFSKAVSDHFAEASGTERRALEDETGIDLTELFDSVQLKQVTYVGAESQLVARGLLGSLLAPAHPAVKNALNHTGATG